MISAKISQRRMQKTKNELIKIDVLLVVEVVLLTVLLQKAGQYEGILSQLLKE
jgi:hypothetical protein